MTDLIVGAVRLGSGAPALPELGPCLRSLAWSPSLIEHRTDDAAFAVATHTVDARSVAPVANAEGQLFVGDLGLAHWHSGHAQAHAPVTSAELSHAIWSLAGDPIPHLAGEYAFATWAPESRSLSLTRNGPGTRPLYVIDRGDGLVAFATLLPLLVAMHLQRHEVNQAVMAQQATGNAAHGTATQFTGIRRVMPGQTLTISPSGQCRHVHWQLEASNPISPREDRRSVMAELHDKIDAAVQRAMPEDGAIHTHLSGGLDSSAIAVLAARATATSGRSVYGYAFGPRHLPDPSIKLPDERPALNAITAMYPNIQLKEIVGTDREALATEPVDWIFPAFSGTGDLYEQVVAAAAADGARRVLSGFGGDEVVSYAGTGALAEMFVHLRWRNMWHTARGVQRHAGRPAWRAVLSEIRRFAVPPWLSPGGAHRVGQNREGIRDLFAFVRTGLWETAAADIPTLRPDSRWLRIVRLNLGNVTWTQEHLAQTAGNYGLHYASPLLDRELLEFAIRLPPEFLYLDGLPRNGLREPLEGILPDESRLRFGKLHFDPGAAYMFARDADALRAVIEELRGTAAETVFDISEMARRAAKLPDPETVLEGLRTAANTGTQWFVPEMLISQALLLARYMAAADQQLRAYEP